MKQPEITEYVDCINMADQLSNDVQNLEINDSADNSEPQTGVNEGIKALGLCTEELYKVALHFYRDKDGKGLHLTYKDKLRMVAYTKQVAHGQYSVGTSPDVGYFDVVGNDRKQAWIALGDMPKETAMAEFVMMIDTLCPLFKPYLEAHKTEKEQAEKKRKEEEEQKKKEEEEEQRKLLEVEAQRQLQLERQRQLEQERQIRVALNQQTAQQFKQYAEQQCPGNTKQQEELILQLQEQHFQQYMQQVYQQQLLHQQQQYQQLQAMQAAQKVGSTETTPQVPPTSQPANQNVPNGPESLPPNTPVTNGEVLQNGDDDGDSVIVKDDAEDDLPPIAAASMWTRKDVKEFKDSLRKDKDAVIKVGSGETVTVRVPTHEDGSCLFWEFATDYYDIGFGVYFEWTIAPNNTVSVHVTESSDEEELEEEEGKGNDVEKGGKKDDRPPMDEIIPVYRRDCHDEVYCGSHAYPGRGVYLLKFDNSYSLWRSKTLYYRVYYSR